MVGGKLTSPAGFKERSLGQTPQKNPGNDEASLRPDAMVASRRSVKGLAMNGPTKTVEPPWTPLPARTIRGVLERVLDNADAIDGT
jgi:hypothetical protein